MGMMARLFDLLFGSGLKEVRDTVEVFRENAEAGAGRSHDMQRAALDQLAQEFAHNQRGLFDRIIDGLNRLPRPGLALGTLGLFIAAMVDPLWFAARMQGVSLVPEPLWWLLGVIVSFYFGARHQAKSQEFQAQIGQGLARLPQVLDHLQHIEQHIEAQHPSLGDAASVRPPGAVVDPAQGDNPALAAWQAAAAARR